MNNNEDSKKHKYYSLYKLKLLDNTNKKIIKLD